VEARTVASDLSTESCELAYKLFDLALRNQRCHGLIDMDKTITLEYKALSLSAQLETIINVAQSLFVRHEGLWKSKLTALERCMRLVNSISLHIANYELDVCENEEDCEDDM
jgi:hypothetical protein